MQVVYHSMLTDRQDEELEQLQSQALKLIYGREATYREMRDWAGVETLRSRRIEACNKFAAKCASGRFAHWFPLRLGTMTSARHKPDKYLETFARCDRLRDSPLHYMRRRLNGKGGKSYGVRNEKYRNYDHDTAHFFLI